MYIMFLFVGKQLVNHGSPKIVIDHCMALRTFCMPVALRCFILCCLAFLLNSCGRSSSKAGEMNGENQEQTLPATISFNEHIQPILSEYCYHCHGPDSGTREPKSEPLRLDRVEDAFAVRKNGSPVIIKGNPEASKIYQLMTTKDEELIMPPPSSHKIMKPDEIALIKRWIEQGAKYEIHWSFAPIVKPEVPKQGEGWALNPIDSFIAEKHKSSGLTANSKDDLRRFYRRMHLDLTGLPPAPDAVDSFIKMTEKGEQQAVEQAADALLSSVPSAEHFARHWLDAARYADTHGIHIDNFRSIWPYRDWVVRAFHQNMPWDQFTLEQIAGDLIPGRTIDQQLATGFNRCLPTTGEGGAIADEYNAIYAADRTETVSAIWIGLTTGCAACHDHKFDPISTKEFYELSAFFRNSTMSALDGNQADHPPNLFMPSKEDAARWLKLNAEIETLEKQILDRKMHANADFQTWLAKGAILPTSADDASLELHVPLDEPAGVVRGFVKGAPREWPVMLNKIDGLFGQAAEIHGQSIDLGNVARFSRNDQVTMGAFIRVDGPASGALMSRMNPAEKSRGWEVVLSQGKPVIRIHDTIGVSGVEITALEPLPAGSWHHLMVTYDGKEMASQMVTLWVDGKKVKTQVGGQALGNRIETDVPLRIGLREGDKPLLDGKIAIQDLRFYRRVLVENEISLMADYRGHKAMVSTAPDKRSKAQNDKIHHYYISVIDPNTRELKNRIAVNKAEQQPIKKRGSISLVMDEKKEEPYAHVLTRGSYAAKGEKVKPNTPAVLPPMPADAPKNRLGLAQWLNSPTNPLPARVTMNRTWYYLFGTGIVDSNDDFGIMGARPSHSKLLDWLAAEFIESKWNYRHMLKLMVCSATYRQSGMVTPMKLEKDPFNKLLARGPRVRLDAEPIRDMALAASGLLSTKVGGAPVKPYQPTGIWEAVAMTESNTRVYKEDSGDALYRRSLYTIWKRTAAPATMEVFNAPTREKFCVRRERTNTPLQALALMNDPQFVEASRELATLALKSSSTEHGRMDFITQKLISRALNEEEKKIAHESMSQIMATYRAQPAEAAQLIAVGAKPAAKDIDAVELASWTLFTTQILNLDETITR